MAELPEKKEKRDDGTSALDDDNDDLDPEETKTSEGSQPGSLECPICLQPCMHPVELPCSHVFCYLCIKGVAMQGPNSKCAICRAAIPFSVLTHPHLKDVSQLYKENKSANGYQWYYESRGGGWWQYDERTMQDLERAFASNQPTCQLLLAGHLYVVDFPQMIQYRSANRNVSRRIKRGVNLEKRGVAGIRISGSNTGAGSSGGANNGSSPPPQSSGPSTRRRRGNSSTAPGSSQQPTATSGQPSQSAASVPVNSAVGNSGIHCQGTNGDSPRGHDGHISDSDDEDEDYNSDYSDVDDDMELCEEEEGLIGDDSDERETEDEEEYESRDGARCPTRSDRSNSSNNQTPPPPGTSMGNGGVSRTYSPNPNNGRGSRGAKSGRSSGGRSSNSNNGAASRSVSNAMSDSLSSTVPVPSHPCASSPIIGQVNYTVSQSLNNIASTNSVKIAFEKHSRPINQEEYI